MDYREDFDQGDALDERYLIDRAEHEAHAEGNEEEPDEPDDEVLNFLELADRYANEVAGRELGDQHHKADRERAEIVRRLDLVRERTADDDGTTTMILEILNGTYPPSGTATHRTIQSWTAVNALQPATAAPVPTLPQLLDQLTTDAVRAEILRRIGELADSMTSAILTVTGGRS